MHVLMTAPREAPACEAPAPHACAHYGASRSAPARMHVLTTAHPLSPQASVRNEMRLDRAVYRLRLAQLPFKEGALIPDEGRPGCVAFGQMRRYKIVTSSAQDAVLSLHVAAERASGLGAVYVGENFAPTESSYTAMVERADPSSQPLRLSLSPCVIRLPTTWHIAVMLEPRAVALSRGLVPTRFVTPDCA